MSFAEKLKQTREQANLSQQMLSEISGVSQAAISAIERGARSPTEPTMLMLAEALHCPISFLLGKDNKRSISDLAPDEIKLIDSYRSISSQGQEYIRQQMYIAMSIYKKRIDIPGVETKIS